LPRARSYIFADRVEQQAWMIIVGSERRLVQARPRASIASGDTS
jgi:hypothetical protein